MKMLLGLCVTSAVLLVVIPGYADADRRPTQPLEAYKTVRKTRNADRLYDLLSKYVDGKLKRSVQQADSRTDSETDIEELLDEVRRYDNMRKAFQRTESKAREYQGRSVYYGDWRKATDTTTTTTSTATPPETPPPTTTTTPPPPTTTTTTTTISFDFNWSWPNWGWGVWKRGNLRLERRRRLLIETFRKLTE